MKEIISIIKDRILENIECLNGFSIFKYDDEYYDIYIPTNTILNYYYFRYNSNNFFDSNSNKINLDQISDCIYPTEDIVEMNYSKILKYTEIYIQEHEMLDYGSYKSPIETEDEDFVNNGYEAFENQDYQQAYNYYNKAIQLNPFTGSNYTRRASCFVKSGQFQEAINDISRGALTNPISKQNIFTFTYEELGNISKLSKDYKNAIKYYTTYLNNSNDYWVIKKRAECYTQINDFDSAINDLKTALIAENDIELICNLGETYLKSGDLKTATNYLEKVINFPNAVDEEWMREMNETLNRPIKDKARKLLMNIKYKLLPKPVGSNLKSHQKIMIKFKIVTRSNLTLLGLAFNENKLPKAKGGEAFYDNDETNEIDNIYFLDSDYYYELLKFIELNKNTFANDKYSFQYLELFEALKKSEKVEYESLDFAKLEHYTFTEPNYEKRTIDKKILENIKERNSSFYEDMKRLYKGYDVTYWGSKKTVVIMFEFNSEKEFIFDLDPIVVLLNGHNLKLEKFNIYRDPRRNLNNVKVVVE